jgi:RimJ/RimL family protein N-acetyltransferase
MAIRFPPVCGVEYTDGSRVYHPPVTSVVFETKRLRVRTAGPEDASVVLALWTDSRVTHFVGFPQGIPTSKSEIEAKIARDRDQPLKRLLIVERATDGVPIGQVKLGRPDEDGISEPDIKLSPCHWEQGYGRELWEAMIDHLFETSNCRIVQGTPNVANTASIRMMEGCGMVRVGEGVFEPGGPLKDSMTPVPHYVYQITQATWSARHPA